MLKFRGAHSRAFRRDYISLSVKITGQRGNRVASYCVILVAVLFREQAGGEVLDPPVYLYRGGPDGQRKVQAVHQALLVHPGETSRGRLGLARAGLRLGDDQCSRNGVSAAACWMALCGPSMRGNRPGKSGLREPFPLLRHVQARGSDRIAGLLPCPLHVAADEIALRACRRTGVDIAADWNGPAPFRPPLAQSRPTSKAG